MREWYPCDWTEENFQWGSNVISISETWEIKVVANPVNSICNSCNHFKQCLTEVIEWTKEQEINEHPETFQKDDNQIILH